MNVKVLSAYTQIEYNRSTSQTPPWSHQMLQHQVSSENLVNFINKKLIDKVNKFQKLQDIDGRVIKNTRQAEIILEELKPIVFYIYSELNLCELGQAFEEDVGQWLVQGLENPPSFDCSRSVYKPVANGQHTFFIGPVKATHGPAPIGFRLECFLAQRREPEILQPISKKFPNPNKGLQSTRLLSGSSGFMTGNCEVFFPENIAVKRNNFSQDFALFFLNKCQRIYLQETMPRVRQLFGDKNWTSANLSPIDCYDATSVWGYLHEYFHTQGPRPLALNLHLKLKWYTGLLEELKCDCKSLYTAFYREDIPFASEILEFIVFERILRYTLQPDRTKNFDAGSGFLLFKWLLNDGCIQRRVGGNLHLDLEKCVASMGRLVNIIEEEIETIENNEDYLYQAKSFVHHFLPKGKKGQYFSVPDYFTELIPIESRGNLLSFENMPY